MAIKDAVTVDARVDTEVPAGVQRDQYGRPKLLAPDGSVRAYTRASTFGSVLEDTFGVNRWAKGMVAFGMGKREDLRLRAAGVGPVCGASDGRHSCKPPCADSPEGKRELREIQEAAMAVSGADRKASLGTALHALTEQIDHGIDVPAQGPRWDPILDRYRELISPFTVLCTEIFTVCEEFGTAGTFDFLLSPRGYLTAPDGEVIGPDQSLIGDKKTSGTAKYFGCKFCVQLKTYQAGEIVDIETGARVGWRDHPAPSSTWALILHLPSHVDSVDDAGWYWVDLTAGQRLAELSRTVRQAQWEKHLVRPMHRGVTVASPDDTKRANAAQKIMAAQSVAALKMVARSYADVWTDELRAAARARADALTGADEGVAV